MYNEICKKYSQSNLEYINLDKLTFKVIRKSNDNFFKIENSDKIRRNLSWQKEVIMPQSTIFDLGDINMLSRIHIRNSNIMKINIEIAKDEEGPFYTIEQNMTVVSGKIRIIKIGSLPCKFLKITVVKGSPLMNYQNFEFYGTKFTDLNNRYDAETLELIYYSVYNFIYKWDL